MLVWWSSVLLTVYFHNDQDLKEQPHRLWRTSSTRTRGWTTDHVSPAPLCDDFSGSSVLQSCCCLYPQMWKHLRILTANILVLQICQKCPLFWLKYEQNVQNYHSGDLVITVLSEWCNIFRRIYRHTGSSFF